MADLPTTDELLKGMPTTAEIIKDPLSVKGRLPTTDQLLKEGFATDGDYSGPVADWHFTNSAGGRILSKFGQGVDQGWGAGMSWSMESDEALRRWGVYNDYEKGQHNLLKGLNELWMRPVIHGIAEVFGAGMGAMTGGIGGASEELQRQGRKGNWLAGATGELLGGTIEGAFGGMGEIVTPYTGKMFAAARARAVIGEGERGYFNTYAVTQKNLEERLKAAKEAGVAPAPVDPPVMDANFIARRMNPELFNEWDKLRDLQENLRLSREYLKTRLGQGYKSDLGINKKLSEIPKELQDLDLKLRDLIPEIQRFREQAELNLSGTSKESRAFIDWARAEMLKAWFARQDLEVEVGSTLGQAESLVPSPRERLELESKAKATEDAAKPEGASKPPLNPSSGKATSGLSGPEEVIKSVKEITGEKTESSPVITQAAEDGTLRPKTESKHLAPAIKTLDGQIITGKLGQAHFDIELPEFKQPSPDGLGWVTPDGKYLNKAEAYEYVVKNFTNPNGVENLATGIDIGGNKIIDASEYAEFARDSRTKAVNDDVSGLKAVEGDGPERTRGLSQSIEASAIEKGLVDAYEELPNYRQMGLEDQAKRAKALIDSDYEKAKRVALGLEEAPPNVYPEALLVAVERQAQANGDWALIRLLATKSKLTEAATVMGQRTRLLGERNKDISPVAVIQDVAQMRKRIMENQKLLDQKDEIIKAGEDALASFQEDWDAFLNSIVCK